MEPTAKRVIIVLMLALSQRSYAADLTKDWTEWVSDGSQLKSAGSYAEAIRAFREALTIAEARRVSDLHLFEIHDHLASTYAEAGQYSEAAHQYRDALGLLEKFEGRRSLDYAVVLGKMALLPGQGASSEDSIAILRQALALYHSIGPPTKVFLVESNLAQILLACKRYAEAEQVLLQLRSDLLKDGRENETLAECLTELVCCASIRRVSSRRQSFTWHRCKRMRRRTEMSILT
jgi:tetratricopeptide (TPR) repeat protein